MVDFRSLSMFADLLSFAAEFLLIRFAIVAKIFLLHRLNISVHLNSSLIKPGSHLLCFLCLAQQVLVKKFCKASAVKFCTTSAARMSPHYKRIKKCVTMLPLA